MHHQVLLFSNMFWGSNTHDVMECYDTCSKWLICILHTPYLIMLIIEAGRVRNFSLATTIPNSEGDAFLTYVTRCDTNYSLKFLGGPAKSGSSRSFYIHPIPGRSAWSDLPLMNSSWRTQGINPLLAFIMGSQIRSLYRRWIHESSQLQEALRSIASYRGVTNWFL